MDSTFDRWGEAVVYVGIVVGRRRARTSSSPSSSPRPRWAPRSWSATPAPSPRAWASRPAPAWPTSASPRARSGIVILTIGLVLAGLLPATADRRRRGCTPNVIVLEIALGLIAVLATITTIQRIVVTLNQAQPEQG